MAKAQVVCTCKKCGKTFVKVKDCHNRREADNWEAWAATHYDVCPDCYAEAKEAQYASTHTIKEMHYGEYKRNYSNCKTVPGSYNKVTKTIKVYLNNESEDPYLAAYKKIASVSKSEIFRTAHQMAKETLKGTTGYNYSVTFAACLKVCYASIKEAKAYCAAHAA